MLETSSMLQVYKGGVDSNVKTTMSTSRADLRSSNRTPTTRRMALLAAAVLLLTCGSSAMAESSDAPTGSIETVIAGILNAWGRADAHAIAAQYEIRGDFVSPDGVHAQGRREIESFYQGAFARGYARSHATATVVHVRKLSRSFALVDGAWSIEPTPASKVRQPQAGLFVAVLHRHAGRWWIAALREQSSARALRELGAPN